MLILVFDAQAQNQGEATKRFSYDTGYAEDQYSNRAVADFGMELHQAFGRLHDLPDFESGWIRSFWTMGYSILLVQRYLTNQFLLTYHEFGHGTRLKALSLQPEYVYIKDFSDKEGIKNAKGYNGFFDYFLASYSNQDVAGGGAQAKRGTSQTFQTIGDWTAQDLQVLVAMGGVNNEMFFTEKMERSIWNDGGHHTYFFSYWKGKESTANYVKSEKSNAFGAGGGDMKKVVNFERYQNDYNITLDDLKEGSERSFYMSAMTYQMLFGYYDYAVNNESTIQAWDIYGLLLPNTSFYLNRKGLSNKYSLGYIVDEDLTLRIASENIYKGDSESELSLGFHYKWGEWRTDLEKIGKNHVATVSYRLTDFFEATIGTAYYHLSSLFGARQIVKVSGNLDETQTWLKLSYVY